MEYIHDHSKYFAFLALLKKSNFWIFMSNFPRKDYAIVKTGC